MSPRPTDFMHFPDQGPHPTSEFLMLCIESMASYMKLAENSPTIEKRERALSLAEGYAKVYRALKS